MQLHQSSKQPFIAMPHTSRTRSNTLLRKAAIMQSLEHVGGANAFKVPDMPDVIVLLGQEAHSRYPNKNKFTEIIESNTVITGEILNIVKSPAFLRQFNAIVDIKTIGQAVNLLGIQKTYQLAMAATIRSIPAQSMLFRSIIDHSFDIAVACAEIASYVQGIDINDAYLFGLFRDAGAIGVANSLQQTYESYWYHLLSCPATGTHAEEENLHIRHDYLGVVAARRWGFGSGEGENDMLIAIQEHHNWQDLPHFDNERVRLLVAIGLLAELMVGEINGEVYAISEINSIKKTVSEVLYLSDEVKSLIRANLLSSLISKTSI
jgi:HD-like signal output (HDOD) protein